MTEFTEDKIFKNVNEEDAKILLDILGIESENVHIWTKELRLLDPSDFKPDIILELDDMNLILELQSTKVNDDFSSRALVYVAVTNRKKENNKQVNLMVLSSADESKTVHYRYNDQNEFNYNIIGLSDLDSEGIMKSVETKIRNHEPIGGKELILYSLVPIMKKGETEIYIKQIVDNLLQLKGVSVSLKDLSYGIAWFTVDKFVTDEEERHIM